MITRLAAHDVLRRMENTPVVALVGPRQAGKSTLARVLLQQLGERSVYLDLERPSDLRKLTDPELYFEQSAGALICIDEVQRRPELFAVMRAVVDERRTNGRFLVLGSASPDLLEQSSETLAGRIAFVELTPFSVLEVDEAMVLWTRGGFPPSYLASGDAESFEWRLDFIRTFLERNLAQLRSRLPAPTMRRLWQMCAHSQGQLLNLSQLGAALGVSHTTVRAYLDLFASAFMVRLLPPWTTNVKKRLVKSPKVYVRDSGMLHALLEIDSFDVLAGHPVYGHSWEGLVVESVAGNLPRGWSASFYRTAHGAEIDLVVSKARRRIAVEAKASTAPELARGFWQARDDVGVEASFVVAPVRERYAMADRVWVVPLADVAAHARDGFASIG